MNFTSDFRLSDHHDRTISRVLIYTRGFDFRTPVTIFDLQRHRTL